MTMSAGERFGAKQSAPQGQADDSPLSWSSPEGWVELAPTQMRMVNFKVGEEGELHQVRIVGNEKDIEILKGEVAEARKELVEVQGQM